MAGWRHWTNEFRLARRFVYDTRGKKPIGCMGVFLFLAPLAFASIFAMVYIVGDIWIRVVDPLPAFSEPRISHGDLLEVGGPRRRKRSSSPGWIKVLEGDVINRYSVLHLSEDEIDFLQARKGISVKLRWEYKVPIFFIGLPERLVRQAEIDGKIIADYQQFAENDNDFHDTASWMRWIFLPLWFALVCSPWWRARQALRRGDHRHLRSEALESSEAGSDAGTAT